MSIKRVENVRMVRVLTCQADGLMLQASATERQIECFVNLLHVSLHLLLRCRNEKCRILSGADVYALLGKVTIKIFSLDFVYENVGQ